MTESGSLAEPKLQLATGITHLDAVDGKDGRVLADAGLLLAYACRKWRWAWANRLGFAGQRGRHLADVSHSIDARTQHQRPLAFSLAPLPAHAKHPTTHHGTREHVGTPPISEGQGLVLVLVRLEILNHMPNAVKVRAVWLDVKAARWPGLLSHRREELV